MHAEKIPSSPTTAYKFRSQSRRDIFILAALGGAYFVAGKLGLKLAFVHASNCKNKREKNKR
jgi:hypothetical protein